MDGVDPRSVDEEQGNNVRSWKTCPFIWVGLSKIGGITSGNETSLLTVGGTLVDKGQSVSAHFLCCLRKQELESEVY